MATTAQQFYEPINVFRQSSLYVKKRTSDSRNSTSYRTWQNNIKHIHNANKNIRKVSSNINDQREYFLSDKLKSDYFSLSDISRSKDYSNASDFSINQKDKLAIAKDNTLKLFNLETDKNSDNNDSNSIFLQPQQQVTVPCEPITKISFYDNNNINGTLYEDLILTGHLDGQVELISTTQTHSKIITKFNHKKFIKHSLNKPNLIESAPIKYITPYSNNHFLSNIGDLIFIYDLNRKNKPLYLNEFGNLGPICKYEDKLLLSSDSCLKLLDTRTNDAPTLLYDASLDHKTINCLETLNNENHIAVGTSDDISILDARYNNKVISRCLETGHVKDLKNDYINNKLVCLNELGTLSSWTLRYESNLRGFKHGFNKSTLKQSDRIQDSILQCGDILVTNGDIRSIQNWNQENILTVGFNEIGLHRMVKQKTIINSKLSTREISYAQPSKYISSNMEDFSDSASTLHGSPLSNSTSYDSDGNSWLSNNELTPYNSIAT